MRAKVLLSGLGVFAVLLSGCSSFNRTPHLTGNGGLDPESMNVWARPLEFGIEDAGAVQGTAFTVKVLGFTIEGDAPSTTSVMAFFGPLLGKTDRIDSLAKIAATRAIESKSGADGVYITHMDVKTQGLFFLYSKKEVEIKGKAVRLKNLGTVSLKRADRIRALEALGETEVGVTGLLPFGE